MKSATTLALGALFVLTHALDAQDKLKRADVFGPDKVWSIHIRLGDKEYQAMQPTGGGMFGFPAFGKKDPPKKEEKKDGEKPDIHKNKGFGIEFPFVKGDIEFEKTLVKDVGIRYRGNSTYQMSAQSLKRPLKIDINHYHDNQKLHGMNEFSLGNGVTDATRIREALAFHCFRAAKVPAARTAFAKVSLTVPGKYDKTYIGLYTLIEPVDKPFLREHFQSDKGMLLKPEKLQGLPYLGDKWTSYSNTYNPKREPTEEQKKRLIDFTRLVNLGDDGAFKKQIGDYLDVDGFLRYAAVNSLITNLDSFFGIGHNYLLYLNPKTNRFHFIPWDLDLSFGGMNYGGGDPLEWSIAQPYTGKNRLTERILAMKEYNDAYRDHLRSLTAGALSPKGMNKTITVLQATIKEPLAKEPPSKGGFGPPGAGKKLDLREFVAKRTESVVAQLDGKSQGKVIAGFGFGGGGKGPGFGGFGVGNFLAKPVLDAADADKDSKVSLLEFKAAALRLFKEAGGADQNAVSDAEMADTINRLMPVPKGFGDFKPPPPPKGFGPGKRIAGAMLKLVDGGADKKLTQAQYLSGADKLFKQWDKDKNGSLDEKELLEGLNASVPPPEFGPGFGPPPGPGDPKKDPAKK